MRACVPPLWGVPPLWERVPPGLSASLLLYRPTDCGDAGPPPSSSSSTVLTRSCDAVHLARPRSASFRWPTASIKKLSGLMSRWA